MPIKAHPVSCERAALFAKGLFVRQGKQTNAFSVRGWKAIEYSWRKEGKRPSIESGDSRGSSSRTSSSDSGSSSNLGSGLDTGKESQQVGSHSPVHHFESATEDHRGAGTSSFKLTKNPKKIGQSESPLETTGIVNAIHRNMEEDSDEEALAAARKRTAAFLYPKSERKGIQQRKKRHSSSHAPRPDEPFATAKHDNHHSESTFGCAARSGDKTFDSMIYPNEGSSKGSVPAAALGTGAVRSNRSSFPLLSTEAGKDSLLSSSSLESLVTRGQVLSSEKGEKSEGGDKGMNSRSASSPLDGMGTSLRKSSEVTTSFPFSGERSLKRPSFAVPPSLTTEEKESGVSLANDVALTTSSFSHQKVKKERAASRDSTPSSAQVPRSVPSANSTRNFDRQCDDVLHELYEAWCSEEELITVEITRKDNEKADRLNNAANKQNGVNPATSWTMDAMSTESNEDNNVDKDGKAHARVFLASDHLRTAFTMAASKVTNQRSSSAPSPQLSSSASRPRPASSFGAAPLTHHTDFQSDFAQSLFHPHGGLPMSMEEVAALQVTQRNERRFQEDSIKERDKQAKTTAGIWGKMHASGRDGAWSSMWFRTPEAIVEEATARLDRFLEGVRWLEKLVRDHLFQTSVAQFLHRHHKLFISHVKSSSLGSKKDEPNGFNDEDNGGKRIAGGGIVSYSHKEYTVFTEFSQHISKAVYQWLNAHVKDFDEAEFAEDLFDTPVGMHGSGTRNSPGNREKIDSELPMNVASYPVWRIILSISSFTCFVDWMVDFIEEEFHLNDQDDSDEGRGVVVAGTRGLKALLASTYRRKRNEKNDLLTFLTDGGDEKGESERREEYQNVTYTTSATSHSNKNNASPGISRLSEVEDTGADGGIVHLPSATLEGQGRGNLPQRKTSIAQNTLRNGEESEAGKSFLPFSPTRKDLIHAENVRKASLDEKQEGHESMMLGTRGRSSRKQKKCVDRSSLSPSTLLKRKPKGIPTTTLHSSATLSLSTSSVEDATTTGTSKEKGKDETLHAEGRSSFLLASSGVGLFSPSFSSQSFLMSQRKLNTPTSEMYSSPSTFSDRRVPPHPNGEETGKRIAVPTKGGRPPERVTEHRPSVGGDRSQSCEVDAPPPPCVPFSSSVVSTPSVIHRSNNNSFLGIRGRGSRHLPPLSEASCASTNPVSTSLGGGNGDPRWGSSIHRLVSPSRLSLSEGENGSPLGTIADPLSIKKKGFRMENGPRTEGEQTKKEGKKGGIRVREVRQPPAPSQAPEEEGRTRRRAQKSQSKKKAAKGPSEKDGGRVPSPLPPPPSLYPS